jgi:hypothetical protein
MTSALTQVPMMPAQSIQSGQNGAVGSLDRIHW